jgi:hypothetical protein
MVETVDFAPGEVSQPHRHNADRVCARRKHHYSSEGW